MPVSTTAFWASVPAGFDTAVTEFNCKNINFNFFRDSITFHIPCCSLIPRAFRAFGTAWSTHQFRICLMHNVVHWQLNEQHPLQVEPVKRKLFSINRKMDDNYELTTGNPFWNGGLVSWRSMYCCGSLRTSNQGNESSYLYQRKFWDSSLLYDPLLMIWPMKKEKGTKNKYHFIVAPFRCKSWKRLRPENYHRRRFLQSALRNEGAAYLFYLHCHALMHCHE